MEPIQVILAYLAAFNAHDTDKIERLVSWQSSLIDSLGVGTSGHAALRNEWETYLRWIPD